MSTNDRDLTLIDYLEQLQLEYIVAELRSKIYKREKDKRFFREKVMSGKRQKIYDISERNPEVLTIFTSEKEMQKFRDQVYKIWGLPNFFYKDIEQKNELEIKDLLNYFAYQNEFLIRVGEDESERGLLIYLMQDGEKITWANYQSLIPSEITFAKVKLRCQEKTSVIHLSNIVRIL